MKKILITSLLLLASGCDALTEFDFELEETLQIPGKSALQLPPGQLVEGSLGTTGDGFDQVIPQGMSDISLTDLPAFTGQAIGPENIEKITLVDITLTAFPEGVPAPYAYLQGLQFIVDQNGSSTVIAEADEDTLLSAERVLVLPGSSDDLSSMADDNVSIRVGLKGNQPLGNRSFSIRAKFLVNLKL
jgi:hypothetical protein